MKTIEEINQIRKEKRAELDLRVNTKSDTREKHILVCHGTGCTSSKSPEILETLRKILKERNIENVRVIMTGCFGLCAKGPIIIIRPEDTFYSNVKPEDCEEIIQTHIIEGNVVERLLCKDIDGSIVNRLDDLNFYKKQKITPSVKLNAKNIARYSHLTARKAFYQKLVADNTYRFFADVKPYNSVTVFRNAFAPVNNNAGVHYFNMITVFAEILRQIKFICNKIQF